MKEEVRPLLIIVSDHDGVLCPLQETSGGKSATPYERAVILSRAAKDRFSSTHDVRLMVSSLQASPNNELSSILKNEALLPLGEHSPIDGVIDLYNLLLRHHNKTLATEGPSFGERTIHRDQNLPTQAITLPLQQTFEGREIHVFFINDQLEECFTAFQKLFPLLVGHEMSEEELRRCCLPFQKDIPWEEQVDHCMEFIANNLPSNLPNDQAHPLDRPPQDPTQRQDKPSG